MEVCVRCLKPNPDISALHQKWHQRCMTCDHCRKAINIQDEIVGSPSTSGIYHSRCWEISAPNCQKCRKPTEDKRVLVRGQYYHENCFVCTTCKGPIRDSKCRMKDRLPYHAECRKSLSRSSSVTVVQGSKSPRKPPIKETKKTNRPSCCRRICCCCCCGWKFCLFLFIILTGLLLFWLIRPEIVEHYTTQASNSEIVQNAQKHQAWTYVRDHPYTNQVREGTYQLWSHPRLSDIRGSEAWKKMILSIEAIRAYMRNIGR
eukprot:NODE_5039_length_1076_cov_80.567681_g4483_i0.p1 GENE.NODE_5039_length_1076_cov_80.567681_g4483_i0~~NODE_5039_length_1076_cov_80.567681_g4483_i0.p1  ORF type:complete len:260 (+),score=28.37 NODE_5039_length_1076_cov_80.567681_g4483_i0:105-884(+)